MESETAVQVFAIIHLATIGFSHVTAPRAWAEFFILLRSKGNPGVFLVAFVSLGFGSMIAAFHSVWSGIPLLLTLIGWSQVFKGALYLAFPAVGYRRLGAVTLERSHLFVYPGVFWLGLSGVLLFHVLT